AYRWRDVKDAEPIYRLITTILDPTQAPARELAALYHERWEIETALDELKTHLRGAQIVLFFFSSRIRHTRFYCDWSSDVCSSDLTTANGMTVETRNLAIFLLRAPGSNQVMRMEIYNLERKREYGGYPVYWLDRANNEESLNYLRGLADAAPASLLAERAVLAISLH